MSCLIALYSQIVTLLSVPHEIVLLRHKVFKEYAKIAVGSDFIHTLPSFLILTAITIILWKNPPSLNSLAEAVSSTTLYKVLQVMISWVVVIALLWLWLILQRLLYCCVWAYWSYETEYRDVACQWWQRVWSSYYPPPLQPPVMSASFISWIICMSIAVLALGCAFSTNRVWSLVAESALALINATLAVKCYANFYLKRIIMFPLKQYSMQEILVNEKRMVSRDEREGSTTSDDYRSEISSELNNQVRREIHPISYGTNWTPKPCFSGYKEPQRKVSMKSLHTIAAINELQNSNAASPRQMQHRRGCHTVIPSNTSEKSSEC